MNLKGPHFYGHGPWPQCKMARRYSQKKLTVCTKELTEPWVDAYSWKEELEHGNAAIIASNNHKVMLRSRLYDPYPATRFTHCCELHPIFGIQHNLHILVNIKNGLQCVLFVLQSRMSEISNISIKCWHNRTFILWVSGTFGRELVVLHTTLSIFGKFLAHTGVGVEVLEHLGVPKWSEPSMYRYRMFFISTN